MLHKLWHVKHIQKWKLGQKIVVTVDDSFAIFHVFPIIQISNYTFFGFVIWDFTVRKLSTQVTK